LQTTFNGKWSTFVQNDVVNNGYGIYLAQNSSYNVLNFNDFAGNPDSNAFYAPYFYGTNNTWSNGTEGNFWDDYSSRYPGATNLGRTWSQPYALNGSTSNVDPHPLVYPWEPNTHPAAAFMVAVSPVVLTNQPVQFIFTGTPGNIPLRFQWNFSDGTTNGTIQHPLHAFSTQRNYTITLTITDADGQSDVLIRAGYITVFTSGGDFDGDGLTNDQEIAYGTDIADPDTDGDAIPDGYEINNGLNAFVPDGSSDADRDGVDNYHEYLAGTRADKQDTDGDGFNDRVEIDWGTDPINAIISPLTIILFPTLVAAAAIVFAFLAVRVLKKKKKVKVKVPSYSRGDWTDEELLQDSERIEEKIDEKRAILSRVMEPMTAEEQEAAVSKEIPKKLSTTSKKKGSGQEAAVTHQVDEQTESEVGVYKKKEFCIVCNTNLKATTYICPHCETKYCIRCAIALSEQKESCWVCKNPLNFSP
jgi:PKD repeat protein